jgi:hypothetical protein
MVVAKTLMEEGEAVLVRLEPGDATRYDFYLICAGFDPRLRAYGLGSVGSKWVWLSPLNLRTKAGAGGAWIDMSDKGGFEYMLRDLYENPWTVAVLATYLRMVADELMRLEGGSDGEV